MSNQIQEKISDKIISHLEGLGTRDSYWVRVTLDRARLEVLDSAGSDPWSEEYREFLAGQIEASARATLAVAVELDEYEWAQGLLNLTRV